MSDLDYFPLAHLRDRSDRGTKFKACCPFHDDRHPSLTAEWTGSDQGVWFCHPCGMGGRIVKGYLVKKEARLPDEIWNPDGLRHQPGRPLSPQRRQHPASVAPRRATPPPPQVQEVLGEVWRRAQERFWESPAQAYLYGRGLDVPAGYLPEGRYLADLDQTVLNGILLTNRGGYISDLWKGRVIFPYTTGQRVANFYGRALSDDRPAETGGKHQYSRCRVDELDVAWNKGLANEAAVVDLETGVPVPGQRRTLLVVEGIIDVYSWIKLGVPSTVGLGGLSHPYFLQRIPIDVEVHAGSDRDEARGIDVPADARLPDGDVDWDRVDVGPDKLPPGERCFRWMRQELGTFADGEPRVVRRLPPQGFKDINAFVTFIRQREIALAADRPPAGATDQAPPTTHSVRRGCR